MLWTILVIALTLALIVIGQLGGTLIHLLLVFSPTTHHHPGVT